MDNKSLAPTLFFVMVRGMSHPIVGYVRPKPSSRERVKALMDEKNDAEMEAFLRFLQCSQKDEMVDADALAREYSVSRRSIYRAVKGLTSYPTPGKKTRRYNATLARRVCRLKFGLEPELPLSAVKKKPAPAEIVRVGVRVSLDEPISHSKLVGQWIRYSPAVAAVDAAANRKPYKMPPMRTASAEEVSAFMGRLRG